MSKPNKAKNYVYYGEYSLSHWVNLIETGNIKLPDYQRSFVWEEEDVMNLIKSFNRNLFVPSVIICRKDEEIEQTSSKKIVNLILDGQQRLSSIYLAAKGKFPKKIETEDQDQSQDEDGDENLENKNVWTLNCLNSKPELLEDKDYGLNNEELNKLLENNYLGFSYLLPDEDNIDIYCASIFKEINTTGVDLNIQERRKASLHMYKNYKGLFTPEFINKEFRVGNNIGFVDFLKMLAFVSLYKKDNEMKALPVKLGSREKIVFDYMEIVISQDVNNDIFYIKDIHIENVSSIQNTLLQLIPDRPNDGEKYKFNNTEEVELYFYGLIYFYIYENKRIKENTDYSSIVEKIKSAIENGKKDKAPNSKSNVKKRLKNSIEIYQDHFE